MTYAAIALGSGLIGFILGAYAVYRIANEPVGPFK